MQLFISGSTGLLQETPAILDTFQSCFQTVYSLTVYSPCFSPGTGEVRVQPPDDTVS